MKKRRMLALFLALLTMALLAVPMLSIETTADDAVWDGVTQTAPAGSGTSTAPYQIATGANLAYIAAQVNAGNGAYTSGKYYAFTADINLGGHEWTPIGINSGSGFFMSNCTIQGKSHKITGLSIAKTAEGTTGNALFGKLQDTTITKLTVEGRITGASVGCVPVNGCSILATAAYGCTFNTVTVYADIDINAAATIFIGGFVGYATYSSSEKPTTFKTCKVYGTIKCNSSSSECNVGGFTGRSKSSSYTGCENYADIQVIGTSGNAYAGGFVGVIDSDSRTDTTSFDGVGNSGSISAFGATHAYIGGLVGFAGSDAVVPLPEAVLDATSLKNFQAGGTLKMTTCFNSGLLYASASDLSYIGSMVGKMNSYIVSYQNCLCNASDMNVYGGTDIDFPTAQAQVVAYSDTAVKPSLTDGGGNVSGINPESVFGARVRLAEGSTGLRFDTAFPITAYKQLIKIGATVKYGTVIAPTSYVNGAGACTKEALKTYAAKMSYATPYLDVAFVEGTNPWVDEQYHDDTMHYFTGAVSNIKEDHYNMPYSGAGYVTVKVGTYSHTFYANYISNASSRSVSYVADRANKDRSDTQDEIYYRYVEADHNYTPYSTKGLQLIQEFSAEYDGSFQADPLELIHANETTEYVIVYNAQAGENESFMANYLQQAVEKLTGVKIPVVTDAATPKATEIVIGSTNREQDYTIPYASIHNGFYNFTAGKRLILSADSSVGYTGAIYALIESLFGVNLSETPNPEKQTGAVVLPWNYTAAGRDLTPDINPNYIDLNGYTVVYDDTADDETQMNTRMAVLLKEELAKCGVDVEISTVAATKQIKLVTDPAYKNGNFKFATTGTTVTLTAGDYYGFSGAIAYLKNELRFCFNPIGKDGYTLSDNFKKWYATGVYASDRYAFEKQGDIRVMFLNVLFGQEGSNKQRNLLQQKMVSTYLPDVLGCQEFSNDKRDGTKDYGGASAMAYNLSTLLADIGYQETILPIVKNFGTKYGSFTADTILGEVTYRTLGGSSTYFNNTPLFFNTETTDYIDGGYYWYVAQWDGADVQSTGNSITSSGDWGSKSLTWGVFEDIASENQYAVISTHMCTRSNTIRALEAMEMIDVVDAIVAKYDVPVFIGGDMNGTPSSGYNIQIFTNTVSESVLQKLEGMKNGFIFANKSTNASYYTEDAQDSGVKITTYAPYANVRDYAGRDVFTDVQMDGMATDFISNARTNHTYPVYNETYGIMHTGANDSTGFSMDSIDHIFAANYEGKVTASVFGVVVDDCTMSASDHYPVFADFTFVNKTIREYTERY